MRRICCWLAVALIVIVGVTTARVSSQERGEQQTASEDEVDRAWPELEIIELYLGAWKVAESHYDPDGQVIATVEGAEEVTWILDHRAIQRRYVSGTRKGVYRAVGTLTWNDVESKYHGVWFDNVSEAGPRAVTGDWADESRIMTWAMESVNKDGSVDRYKVEEQFFDEQRRMTTTYKIEGGKLTKILEVDYDRISLCPKGPRVFFGG